jgi:hypothetical protein
LPFASDAHPGDLSLPDEVILREEGRGDGTAVLQPPLTDGLVQMKIHTSGMAVMFPRLSAD